MPSADHSGGHWRKVSRTVDVDLTVSGDGSVEVAGARAQAPEPVDLHEPCYGCSCCQDWARMLEQLRAAALAHRNPHPLLGPQCPTEQCLICALGVTW